MLPIELCNLVIDYLHDSKPSLLACSLVCRAWVPECRIHLFHKVLLNHDTADPFFQLLESPHATLALAHTRKLIVAQNRHPTNRLLHNGLLENLGILSRCPADVFEHVRKLSVTWIGWWTLSDAERLSVGQRFKNVTELDLWMIYFQTDKPFQAFVGSFPALEVLSLDTIRLVNNLEENHLHAEHKLPANLHTILLKDISSPRVIRSLTPCPLLRVFKCQYDHFGDFKPALAKELNRLLLSAGGRLEDFEFIIDAEAELNDGANLDDRFNLIDVARIPNIRRIKFSIEGTGRYLIPFLKRLAESRSSTSMLETLDIHHLFEYDLDWEMLDDVLEHPYFHALREIKTTVEMYFTPLDVVGQEKPERPGWYSRPNDGSRAHIDMERNIAEFVGRLPKCHARGLLQLTEMYRFWDLWD